MPELSEFEEMYLKRMFEMHSDQPDAIVKTSMLAELMGVSAASTTEMIQRLSGRERVTYIPYKGSRLTPDGFARAAQIKRRQLLLELLLADVIGFDGDVHSAACEMEHAIDSELEEAIDRLLGYPERTPSGERIPLVSRRVEPAVNAPLLPIANMPEGSSGTIEFIALEGQDTRTLQTLGLIVGQSIKRSSDLLIIDGAPVSFSDSLATRILVRVEMS